ncbi:ABC transporter permease [Bacillus benzoevorans]|uniref:Cu-processing system permease protein n=1 Tax=Bacillus benzoevorans TaxID=1456 RepID=A0A7X0HV04_9BACI|nr:ABC transporter permease subunit [Bacillus benzoevorans]MBB6447338.1 Cu-processing system permease protein [Bacillus benzoevorans]
MGTICQFEWRKMLRQKSSYLFLVLWTFVLLLIFLLVKGSPVTADYTNITGTAVNLLLYLLPLFMLITGSFAIAAEMENGQWKLLNTYPVTALSYLSGKLIGQLIAQTVVFTLSFGISLLAGLVFQVSVSMKWVLAIYLFSILLQSVFLVIGVTAGAFAKTRWQALSVSVVIWFVFIMIWPTLLISVLNLVPYQLLSPVIHVATVLNPAELLRVVFVVQMGGGAVFGQAYDVLVTFIKKDYALYILLFYMIFISTLFIWLASWRLERRRAA